MVWNSPTSTASNRRGNNHYPLCRCKTKEPLFSGSILQFLFLRLGVGLFYEVNDSFECLRIVHREVGEGFAVKLDALLG